MKENLKIISLGGFGQVTNNMFVYEAPGGDILIVDCGIGFPSQEMFGVDLLIPDVSYLEPKKNKIRGIILTHGHEDHTGALPFVLPRLGRIPVFAARLTAALVREKLAEYGIGADINEIDSDKVLGLGEFTVSFARVTHSIPDTLNVFIRTREATIFHASDFKFDWTPPDGKFSEVGKIAKAGESGVDLLLSDSLRSERVGTTPSESTLSEMFDRELAQTPGKFIMTTMSSNISRIQQLIDAALSHGRKVGFVGRSIQENVEVATKLGYMKIRESDIVPPQEFRKHPDGKLALVVAGAQAQPGSALEKIALDEHKFVKIKEGDRVVFSTDYIPGNEVAIHALIDTLTRRGATVSYQEITDNLHVSGHASRDELALMIALTHPRYLLPIGGTVRHMKQYKLLASAMGYGKDKILLPEGGQVVRVGRGFAQVSGLVDIRAVMVDALGVGDVGPVVLRDRKVLASEGVVVVVIQMERATGKISGEPDLVTRGFVFAKKHEEFLRFAASELKKELLRKKWGDGRLVREIIVDFLERFFFEETGRRPMILPVVVEI